MKNKFENAFKESLEHFELPYDSSAWSQLEARLDQMMPISPKSGMGTKGWVIAATTVVTVAVIGGIIYSTSADTEIKITEDKIQQEQVKTSDTDNQINSIDDREFESPQQLSSNSESVIGNEDSKSVEQTNRVLSDKQIISNGNNDKTVQQTVNNDTKVADQLSNDQKNNSTTLPPKKGWIIPKVSTICTGEQLTLKNDNDELIYLQDPNGKTTRIAGQSSVKIKAEQAGTYSVVVLDKEGSRTLTTFNALSSPRVDFTIDQYNKFDNGLPTTGLSSNSVGVDFEWTFEGSKQKLYGEKVIANFYKKGKQNIHLTITDESGCKASATKSIQIEEDYNLMAVTGFYPLDVDPRVNRFIPYALTERNTPFTMIIVDPKDGGIVYETTSASNPWDGIDKRTGKLVDVSATFVWKVILKNPEPGEKPEYKGMITRM